MPQDALILWPATGCPALLPAGTTSFAAYLHSPGLDLAGAAAGRYALSPVGPAPASGRLPLAVRQAREVSLPDPATGNLWAPWVCAAYPRVFRLELALERPVDLAGRRNALLDLHAGLPGADLVKPGAVWARQENLPHLDLCVASDIHVASRWDHIAQEAPRVLAGCRETFQGQSVAAAFSASFINPNRNFAAFIRECNARFDAGAIDAVFLLGDLVDYKFATARPVDRTFTGTEWSTFCSLLLDPPHPAERLRAPLLATTGNHDYRLYPYRIRTYGLRHCNVPKPVTDAYLKRTGQYHTLKYRLSDLGALQVSESGSHSLEHYYTRFNPFDCYAVRDGDRTLLAFDTGPDAICRLRNLFSARCSRYLREILCAVEHPHSAGMEDAHVEYLERVLAERTGRPAFLFHHAPALHASAAPAGGAVPGLGGCPATDRAADLAFERRLDKAGLLFKSLFKNQRRFLCALRGHGGPALSLAGHVHLAAALAMDLEQGTVAPLAPGDGTHALQPGEFRMLVVESLAHINRSQVGRQIPRFKTLRLTARTAEISSEAAPGPGTGCP